MVDEWGSWETEISTILVGQSPWKDMISQSYWAMPRRGRTGTVIARDTLGWLGRRMQPGWPGRRQGHAKWAGECCWVRQTGEHNHITQAGEWDHELQLVAPSKDFSQWEVNWSLDHLERGVCNLEWDHNTNWRGAPPFHYEMADTPVINIGSVSWQETQQMLPLILDGVLCLKSKNNLPASFYDGVLISHLSQLCGRGLADTCFQWKYRCH